MISHSHFGNAHKAEFLKEINVLLRNNQQLNGKSILTFEDDTELIN